IPSGEQAEDLEAPQQEKNVGEDARLDLRNVDRILLLVDAGLHAVVADPMAGTGAHRIVDHHHRQTGDAVAVSAEEVHLADALVERAAGERNAERIRLDLAVLLLKSTGAGVFL